MRLETDKIAIFVDVENLTSWIKEDGPEKLLDEICTLGQPVVRRAYGNWNSPAVSHFQAYLNRLGFELVHNFHPVSGKNSSDIQMTVDVIEYAWNLKDLQWFVLATGDSDFSPLFRRLREMGKGVIGVGPRSTLSETVKTSCSRYIYTESMTQQGEMAIQSAYEDAVDNVGRVLSSFGDNIHLSLLKTKLLNLDSAFDEKQLGYTSFSTFIESIEEISLNGKNTICRLKPEKTVKTHSANSNKNDNLDLSTQYRAILRKKNWRILPKEYLITIFDQLKTFQPSTKEKLLEDILQIIGKNITPTDVRKAFSIFIKCHLLKRWEINNSTSEILWAISNKDMKAQEMLVARDIAVAARICNACLEEKIKLENSSLNGILYSTKSTQDVSHIIEMSKKYRE
ncbi:MAG: NYN domain-containing protein [Proteobacteria bacterium]|nr:NYN domain-containing protein [Pseudomonadota bacterium]